MTITAIQMDDIFTIQLETDTSFALGLEAQRRGHRLFYYRPHDLFLREGALCATGHFMHLSDQQTDYVRLRERVTLNLAEASFVLIRQDPPFDLAYITTTHLLEHLPPSTRVVNDPIGIRNAPEKLLVTHFQDLTSPTLISKDPDQIADFMGLHGTIILKPLFDFGGRGIFKLSAADSNKDALLELYETLYKEPFIVQKFIPEITEGDKRILLVNGEPMGIFKRIPQSGQARSNMRSGGQPHRCDFSERDQFICAQLKPVLQKMGLFFVGIDVIGPYLTEINVTSPTGMRVMNRLYDLRIETTFWDVLLSESSTHKY